MQPKWNLALLKILLLLMTLLAGCKKITESNQEGTPLRISRSQYQDQLYGFWLGQCIANWTGLVTEMDKIGNIGAIKTGDFYTMDDWGQPDQPSIWGQGIPSDLSPTIDFVIRDSTEIWGADDDTDIEYMYQHLLHESPHAILTPEEIRDGWLRHIKPEEENYLWVSNQRAYDLLKTGMLPPETGLPQNNEHYDMIDAQLTTEIFGLFAPGRRDIALKLAEMPIRSTASQESEYISQFYVTMHALASVTGDQRNHKEQIFWMEQEARQVLPDTTYPAKMYDFIYHLYQSGIPWEEARDGIYQRYQIDQADGYDMTSRDLYCNGCFAAGINYAASLISLFYGQGNLKETIKIGSLTGWDSDNPTATWGGLIGFMIGQKGVKEVFGKNLSNRYNIHRTRQGFPNNGLDTFESMAQKGIHIIDKVVLQEMGGKIDSVQNEWIIPMNPASNN